MENDIYISTLAVSDDEGAFLYETTVTADYNALTVKVATDGPATLAYAYTLTYNSEAAMERAMANFENDGYAEFKSLATLLDV